MSAKRTFPTVLRDIGLFFAAPVIALSYLVLFPYFAITMLLHARKAKRVSPAPP